MKKHTTPPSPPEIAFATAQRLALRSAAARLSEAAIDLTVADVIEGIDETRKALMDAYEAVGTACEAGDLDLRDEAAYLYGLAVGVSLGRGGAR